MTYSVVDTYTGRTVGRVATLAEAETMRDRLGSIRFIVRLPLTK